MDTTMMNKGKVYDNFVKCLNFARDARVKATHEGNDIDLPTRAAIYECAAYLGHLKENGLFDND